MDLHQRFVWKYLEAVVQGATNLVRAVRRTADETPAFACDAVPRRQQTHHGSHTTGE